MISNVYDMFNLCKQKKKKNLYDLSVNVHLRNNFTILMKKPYTFQCVEKALSY